MPEAVPQGARVRVLDLRVSGTPSLTGMVERGVLEAFASSEPVELMAQLRAQGFVVSSTVSDGTWLVRAGKGGLPPLEDLTDLEAPEPMHRILAALARLAPGEVFLALLPHRPAPLLPLLDARGATWEVALRPDGRALLWLSR